NKVSKTWISIGILLIGVLLFCVHGMRFGAAYIQGLFIQVQRPVTFQPAAYKTLLKKYVKDGKVDYAHMKRSPELAAAVDELEKTSADNIVNDSDKLAYWINAYNLITLK